MAPRGAIALGSVLVEKTPGGTFVAGSAVVEAYCYEKSQDWEERVALRGRLPWPACLHVCHSIPFHSSNAFESSSFDGFAILPTNHTEDPEGIRDDLAYYVESFTPHDYRRR